MSIENKLRIYAENHLNTLLIGTHGVGKSTVVKLIAEDLGLSFKYYSASTLDPYSELIGIPVPDRETKTVDFYRPSDLETAEFVFFDELNRVTNPRILNTVLEIIQFKSINGNPLNNLKMVWAAINPPSQDYQVEDLDPALVDRFHMYVKMPARISLRYLKKHMSAETAKVVKKWWQDDLDQEQKRILTPRRIEYIGNMIDNNIPWRDAIPQGHTFPVKVLADRIAGNGKNKKVRFLDKETILTEKDSILEELESDPKYAIEISKNIMKFNCDDYFEIRDILEKLPIELIMKIGEQKFSFFRSKLKKCFLDDGVDISDYPKVSKAFSFNKVKDD